MAIAPSPWPALDLPTRQVWEGFSHRDAGPETVLVGGPERLERSSLTVFAVQPGVRMPARAHRKWSALARSYDCRPEFVTRVPAGLVDLRARVVLSPDRLHFVHDRVTPTEDRLSQATTAPIELDVPVIAALTPSPRAWFHFWPETAARALLFREIFPDIEAKLLLPELEVAFRAPALAYLGFEAGDVLEVPPDSLVRAPEVYVPSTGQLTSGQLAPSAIRRLRRAVAREPSGPRRRLYATRHHERRRRVSNEAELRSALERLGFETVVPHHLSFEEQIELFADAEAVIGVHGGALTNVLFAPEDCVLVELMPEDADRARRQLFWNLSATCGQRYAQVTCAVTKQNAGGGLNVEVHVDAAHLEGILELLLPG